VLTVFDFKPFAPHCFEFKSLQGIRILSCEEAIQLAYETMVVLLKIPLDPARKGTQGLPPPVKLEKEHNIVAYTVLVWT
jgi:hypothetical protein